MSRANKQLHRIVTPIAFKQLSLRVQAIPLAGALAILNDSTIVLSCKALKLELDRDKLEVGPCYPVYDGKDFHNIDLDDTLAAMLSKLSHLDELTIRASSLAPSGTILHDLPRTIEALAKNSTIRHLKLISSQEDEWMLILLRAVISRLHSLRLSFSDTRLSTLWTGLPSGSELKRLTLINGSVWGTATFSGFSQKFPRLEHLELDRIGWEFTSDLNLPLSTSLKDWRRRFGTLKLLTIRYTESEWLIRQLCPLILSLLRVVDDAAYCDIEHLDLQPIHPSGITPNFFESFGEILSALWVEVRETGEGDLDLRPIGSIRIKTTRNGRPMHTMRVKEHAAFLALQKSWSAKGVQIRLST